MKKSITSLLSMILFVTMFSSCAKNVVVHYQQDSKNTGSVKVKPTKTIKGAAVTLDGTIMWEKKKAVKSITIANVPKGNHTVKIACDSWCYKEALDQKESFNIRGNNDNKTILVSVPPYSTGYYLYLSAMLIVCCLPAMLL